MRVERTERSRVGDDDDAPRRVREQASLVVDDRAARADQVDGAERLVGRERLVRRPMQDLDRPRAQGEQGEGDADDDGEPADPDEEARAAEVRRVDP
ncbi:MAG TPA: hypothetical protein VGG88_00530 [Gaiellaceae bacterium]